MNIDTSELKRQWAEEGYIVIRGLVDRQRIDRLRASCENVLKQWLERDPETGKPGNPNGRALRNINHPAYFRDHRAGLAEVLELVADPAVLQAAQIGTKVEPMFRSTTLWFQPLTEGMDGNWHRDTQFHTATDEAEKAMIANPYEGMALQIALAPTEDSEYVPRSHLRWDTAEEYRIRKADNGANAYSNQMPGAVRVRLEPGDAVGFNSSGLHRGRYHMDKIRRTLMFVYNSEALALDDKFTRQTWFLEPGYLDGLSEPAREFFRRFIARHEPKWNTAEAVAH